MDGKLLKGLRRKNGNRIVFWKMPLVGKEIVWLEAAMDAVALVSVTSRWGCRDELYDLDVRCDNQVPTTVGGGVVPKGL